MTKHELRQIDKIVTLLIEQGHSPYQIVTNHPELNISVRTLYTYIGMGLFCARNINLKRKVGFKPRKCYKTQITDRGAEFRDPESLETGVNGIQRTSIYYCDPMQSGQKGGLEQAHTMLRMILSKGTSFEFLTQWNSVSHTALSVMVEVGDFGRFASAQNFVSYLGPVPGEDSSGDGQTRLGITKAGNRHVCIFLLICT